MAQGRNAAGNQAAHESRNSGPTVTDETEELECVKAAPEGCVDSRSTGRFLNGLLKDQTRQRISYQRANSILRNVREILRNTHIEICHGGPAGPTGQVVQYVHEET